MTTTDKKSRISRIKRTLKEYPGEFEAHDSLWCSMCKQYVNSISKSTITDHRASKKHKRQNNGENKGGIKRYSPEYIEAFVDGLVKSDIPLKKTSCTPFKNLFKFLKVDLPSGQHLENIFRKICT